MDNQPNIEKLTDHLFRHESGKMVSVLTKIFGTENLELAEDVVQDTYIMAIKTWRFKGIPDNPSAWLFRVARNKAIDIIRRNKFSQLFDFNDPERALLKSEYTLESTMDNLWKEEIIHDDLLRMMFACCHDDIAPESQITLILKTLCGFSTAEIAKAFLTSEDTISKRLYRTREFFRAKKIKPEFPDTIHLKDRIEAVLKAIYLLFNEGYNSTHADELIRTDLLEQSVYLCKLLCDNKHTQHPEVFAAMALMCFQASRTTSRISNEGEIILLDEQDRSKWDQRLIAAGNNYMNKAAVGDAITSYHIEAAIAFEHCIAKTFEKTNWQQILVYYNWLSQIHPTPTVMLNRLIVIYRLKGASETLSEIKNSHHQSDWEKNYLYHSLLGELFAENDRSKAKDHFKTAIRLTQSDLEKKLLKKKIANL